MIVKSKIKNLLIIVLLLWLGKFIQLGKVVAHIYQAQIALESKEYKAAETIKHLKTIRRGPQTEKINKNKNPDRFLKDRQKIIILASLLERQNNRFFRWVSTMNILETVFCLICTVKMSQPREKLTISYHNVIQIFCGITFIYYLASSIMKIVDMFMKKNIFSRSSYKNSLTLLELDKLLVKLMNTESDQALKEGLLEFIDTKNLQKRNYLNADPIKWIISTKIANNTIERFSELKDRSNTEIINGIIKNYKRDSKDSLVNISWMFLIFNVVRELLLIGDFIFALKDNRAFLLCSENTSANNKSFMFLTRTIMIFIIPMILWGLEWLQCKFDAKGNSLILEMVQAAEDNDQKKVMEKYYEYDGTNAETIKAIEKLKQQKKVTSKIS